MAFIQLKDALAAVFRSKTVEVDDAGTPAHAQGIVQVDPATGAAAPGATEATLLALNTAIGTLNTVSAAVQAAVEAMNTKTTAINTGAIAGTVELGATSLAALESVQATIANFPTTQQIVGDVDATGSTVAVGNFPANQPISADNLPLPTGAATETTLGGINTAIGSPADSAATTDAGSFSLLAFFKRLLGKLPDLINGALRIAGYDPGDDMIKVKSVQKKWRDSFVGSSLNTDKWGSSIGTGGAITVGSGVLTMGSGTTANAETYALTKETFTIPFRVNIGLTLSQRIANQTFLVEAVSVDAVTGVPDGKHCVALLFDGTTATQAKYRVQNSGATPLDSAASTFPTTASAGFYELEPFSDEAWFHGGTLDATSGRANSYRRHQQIPEPNAVFKIRLRWLNGSSAPASNTNAVIQYLSIQDYAELTAEITAGRGQTVAGQALGAHVVNTVAVSGTVTSNLGTWTAPTPHTLNSAASTNATSVKASAGTMYMAYASNNGAAAAYLKLYNKASAPTVGTDTPVLIVPIPAGGVANPDLGTLGHRFATGIAYAITGAIADADTTAVAAGQVKVALDYI